MKLWAVHFISESSDHYYYSFRCETRPTERMLEEWWRGKACPYGEQWDCIGVNEIWEIDPEAPILE